MLVLTVSLFLTACAGHQKPTTLIGEPDTVKDARITADGQIPSSTQLESGDTFILPDPPLDAYGQIIVDFDDPLTDAERKALEAPLDFEFVLDIQETKDVERFFRFFTHDIRDRFEIWLKRSEQFLPEVRDIFAEYGIPHDLIYLPFLESGYNPMAYSRAGAGGMWQFMPRTGESFGMTFDWWIDQRRCPRLSTHAAAAYLSRLYNMFDDWYLALAAYNAGEGRISRAMQRSGTDNYFDLASINNLLANETRHYVPKFMAILKIIQNLEELGFDPIDWNNSPRLAEIEITGGTDLVALASTSGMDWDTFRQLNPSFRRQVSPPGKKVTIFVPEEKQTAVAAYLKKPSSAPFTGFQRYQVRRGDSWYVLSSRFDTPIDVLKRINNRTSNTLRIGESVMVPASPAAVAAARQSGGAASTQERASQRANHVVQSGDTLWSLARRHGVTVQTLAQANGITSGSTLRVGQRLYIPQIERAGTRTASATTNVVQYRVRSGDTLWRIAQRYGVTTSNLVAWNKLPRNGLIRPGDNLKIYVTQ
ncbi:lytic transglycosylase domain-containing protein [Desulfonatronum sp. SC1]|uniref:lytic transglycosylase domain-containing protein n=1 Tax=Desulfonatronum sp. SC1 TaxID=2109626 RepID=UPI001304D637|nr:lytic transglycosylase domain-containing protein [Desulfonatronum sp. SC1]